MSSQVQSSRRSIGDIGEDIAVTYLKNKGLAIIARNYQIKWGEIDIIAQDGEITVFIEVRYRKDESHGHPLDTFWMKKRRTLYRTVMFYALKNKIDPDSIRIDFVGIMPVAGKHRIWWVRGVSI